MRTIDGSRGEGGGQVLRVALAIAATTGEDVRVERVRSARSPGGLRPQHLASVTALAALCGGTVDGAVPGSRTVTLRPGEIRGGSYRFDVGTAGSLTLLLQALMPAMAASRRRFTLDLVGGTDVRWSPPWDTFVGVHVPLLARFGVDVRARLKERGHYPEGHGQVHVEVAVPGLRSVDLVDAGEARDALVRAHSANLPPPVLTRLASAARGRLEATLGVPVAVAADAAHGGRSPGCGVTTVLRTATTLLGGDALGERGVPAEDVGKQAAEALLAEVETGAAVDVHEADQLVPFLALSGGGSFRVREVTPHTATTLELVAELLGVEAAVEEDGATVLVHVGGA